MRESEWNNRLNNKLKHHLREVWKIQCIAHNGIPDNYYLGELRSIWMEAKMIKSLPVRPTTLIVPDCSELQLSFLRNQSRIQSNALVITAVKKVEGHHGAMCFPYLCIEEWEQGIPKQVAENRLMTYDQCVEFLTLFANHASFFNSALQKVLS